MGLGLLSFFAAPGFDFLEDGCSPGSSLMIQQGAFSSR
jgi:hypothetical protein